MIVLKLDGSIWRCAPGWDTDENSLGGVREIPTRSSKPEDKAALAKGITHRQTSYGGNVPCHELEQLGEVGDGQKYR